MKFIDIVAWRKKECAGRWIWVGAVSLYGMIIFPAHWHRVIWEDYEQYKRSEIIHLPQTPNL